MKECHVFVGLIGCIASVLFVNEWGFDYCAQRVVGTDFGLGVVPKKYYVTRR